VVFLSIRGNEVWSGGSGMAWTRDQNSEPSGPRSWEVFEIRIQTTLLKPVTVTASTRRSDMMKLVNNVDSFPDIKFIVGDRTLVAHKAILANRSTYFHSLFTNGMKETHQNAIQLVDIPSPDAFLAVLHYLYCNEIKSVLQSCSVQQIIDIWFIFHTYRITHGEHLCEQYLQEHVLHPNMIISLLQALEKATIEGVSLWDICIKFAAFHLGEVVNELPTLAQETIAKLLEFQKQYGHYLGPIH